MNSKLIVKYISGFLLLTIFAFFLRTHNLNEVPVFADEAIYIRWAQIMQADSTLRFLPMTDGKQPLFMWTVIPMFKVFSDPLIAGRMISALSGIGTMIGVMTLTFMLASRFDSKKYVRGLNMSFVAGLIYAISPFTVFFDRLALVDSMLSMFGVWFFIFLFSALYFVRLDLAMIAGFALGGALLTKSPALFLALMSPSLWILAKWPESGKRLHVIKLGLLHSVSLGIAYMIYNILRLGPNFHLLTSRTKDYVYPLSHIFESPLDPFLPFFDRSFEYYHILGPTIVLLLAGISLVLNVKKRKSEMFILLIWFIVPVLIVSEFSKTMTARYIYYSFPFLIIIAALLFDTSVFRELFKDNKYRVLRHLVIFSILISILGVVNRSKSIIADIEHAQIPRSERSGFLEEWTSGTGIREAADFIKNEYKNNPNQKIVVGTEGHFGTLPDALQMYMADTPDVTVIGVGLDFTTVPIQLTESFEFGNRTYLVVNSSRLKTPEDELSNIGFVVVKKWQKSDRPSNISEYDRHGRHDTFYLLEVTARGV